MDGPSVNKLFKEKFESDLEKKGHFIIDVRSCPLHTRREYRKIYTYGTKMDKNLSLLSFAVIKCQK